MPRIFGRASWRRLCAAALLAVIAGLVGAGLVGAGLAGPASAAVFAPETFTLANGMQVVVIANHRAPIVTHMVWYKVGSADDPVGKSGVAHFLEHLMFRGTKTVPAGEFSAMIARVGGDENAFTGADFTAYFQNVAAEQLGLAMRLESDRMANLIIVDAIADPERDVVLEERRQRTDNDPGAQLNEAAQAALYLNHPYRRPTIGWESEIRSLTASDALDFYRRWYRPNNAILVVSGDVTLDQVRSLAETYYGPVASGPVPARVRATEPPARAARRVELRNERVEQAAWMRRYLAPSYRSADSEQAPALEVLAQILGGGPTSRLYRRLVVERKVAAAAGAGYDPDRLDLGVFGLYATPAAGTDARATEQAMDEEIAGLLADGVSEAEIASAKRLLLADAVKARDSLSGPAHIVGQALAAGSSIAEIESWPERIGAVTLADITAAASAVFRPEASVTAVLLPAKGN